MAPPMAMPGDNIYILDGGVVPFAVRKSVEIRGGFELVSECYIHGLMNGEGSRIDANGSLIILR